MQKQNFAPTAIFSSLDIKREKRYKHISYEILKSHEESYVSHAFEKMCNISLNHSKKNKRVKR